MQWPLEPSATQPSFGLSLGLLSAQHLQTHSIRYGIDAMLQSYSKGCVVRVRLSLLAYIPYMLALLTLSVSDEYKSCNVWLHTYLSYTHVLLIIVIGIYAETRLDLGHVNRHACI